MCNHRDGKKSARDSEMTGVTTNDHVHLNYKTWLEKLSNKPTLFSNATSCSKYVRTLLYAPLNLELLFRLSSKFRSSSINFIKSGVCGGLLLVCCDYGNGTTNLCTSLHSEATVADAEDALDIHADVW